MVLVLITALGVHAIGASDYLPLTEQMIMQCYVKGGSCPNSIGVHALTRAGVVNPQVTVAVGNLRPSLRSATTFRRSNRVIQTNARLVVTHATSSQSDTEKLVNVNVPEIQAESNVAGSFYLQRALLTATASLAPFLLIGQVLILPLHSYHFEMCMLLWHVPIVFRRRMWLGSAGIHAWILVGKVKDSKTFRNLILSPIG